MSNDWRATQAARDAAAKRRELDGVDALIAEAEQHLSSAREFEGWATRELAAVERQMGAIGPVFAPGMEIVILRRPNEAGRAELERLRAVRGNLEREIEEHKARATVKTVDRWGRALSLCTLSVIDVSKRLHHLRAVRGQVAAELADLESRCTPGELCLAGSPAPDYTQYVKRTEALRSGRAVVRGFTAAGGAA